MVRVASPWVLLLAAVLASILFTALTVVTALRVPWLGVTLTASDLAAPVVVAASDPGGPAAGLFAPVALRSVGGHAVEAADLVEDPDFLDAYDRVDLFLARQTAFADALAAGVVPLGVADAAGAVHTIEVVPRGRPLSDLPLLFWVQIVSGAGGFLIGAWIWSLRRRDWGARMFALTGAALMLSAFPAAIYSTRELALDGGLFRVLSALNHAGALLFAGALTALFLFYPKRIAPPRALLVVALVVGPVLAIDLAHLAPGPEFGLHLPIMVAMAAVLVLIGLQWRATRHDPAARAALRWLGLSVVLGCAVFIVAVAAPLLLGAAPVVRQGWAFAFFLLIYAGIALGLARYRLFELDEWAFRVLFVAGAALLLLIVDAALMLVLHFEAGPSLAIALLAVAFLYLPLRDTLWRATVARRRVEAHELFPAVMAVAFGPGTDDAARAERWRALLARLFAPLAIAPAADAVAEPALRADGVELALPALAGAPALVLRHPWGGRGLFGPEQLALARQLVDLTRHAEEGRAAHERGAAAERRRIARDLHDDVGARLLSAVHRQDAVHTRRIVREAIADIRMIVGGLAGERLALDRVLADLRHETAQRLEAGGLSLDWPLPEEDAPGVTLAYAAGRNLVAAVRESVSNILRHSGARHVTVRVETAAGTLRLALRDDGRGMKPGTPRTGHGLDNIRRRMAELGGSASFPETGPETRGGVAVILTVPLAATAVRSAA